MKNILILIALLFSINIFSQQVTLLYLNSEWNSRNDYKKLKSLRNVQILEVDYDVQPQRVKDKVKSVPAIMLFDRDKNLKKVWEGGLSMRLEITPEEIQSFINKIMADDK